LKKVENNHPVTDSGRPIAMVVRGTKEIPTDIFINCHMINASVLKIFTHTDNVFKEEFGGKTLLQMSDTSDILSSGKTGNELWFDYCVRRIEDTIDDMLENDFEINSFVHVPNIWIMGDFNDPQGHLFIHFSKNPITIRGMKFKIQFGNAFETCCPNTNSSQEKEDETVSVVKYKAPFNKSLRDLITNDEFTKRALDVFKRPPLFKGDNIGKAFSIHSDAPIVEVETIEPRTSDHYFVKTKN
jgi:hypothetical protein